MKHRKPRLVDLHARLPEALHERIMGSSRVSLRTLNAEMVFLLTWALEAQDRRRAAEQNKEPT